MAGHSKWANIKHKKAAQDAKKGKIFSRVTKEIISAVKQGGSDPKANPKLRLALQKAKAVNLPNDNIERNIKKAASQDQSDYLEVTYELYGHGGVGLVVEGMTDNKNRMASDMRIATNKRGGSIASPGAVVYNFDRKGILAAQDSDNTIDEETMFELAIAAGAEDFEKVEADFIITTSVEELYQVKEALEEKSVFVSDASLEYLPKVYIDCSDEDYEKNKSLIDWLEDLEDVDNVYHNMQLR